MSYIALARKYRPQTFDELVGQEFVSTSLKNAISLGRVSHAYLFTGARGVGKTSAARILAKALNCLSPVNNNPCNQCENCLEITAGTAMDVVEVDGASNRGIDEIRQLREAVKFIPVKFKYKVYIIDEVHMLTEQASNALLKTLEEPPSYVVFIFATTDSHKVIGTILSRCQRYDFKRIGFEEMTGALSAIFDSEKLQYDTNALNLIVRQSEGCMRDALSISDQIISYTAGKLTYNEVNKILGSSQDPVIMELFNNVLQENATDIEAQIHALAESGASFLNVCEKLVTHTRNLLLLANGGKTISKELTAEELDFYRKAAKSASAEKLFALFQLFQKLYSDIKYSAFARYSFEFGIFKAASLSRIIPLPVPSQGDVPKKPQKADASNTAQKNTKDKAQAAPKDTQPVRTASILNEIASSPALNNEEKKWHEFLHDLKSESPGLAASLIHAVVEEITAEKLQIYFPPERKFQYSMATRPENLTTLNNFARRKLGTGVVTEIRNTTQNVEKTLHEKKSELENLYEKQVKDETLSEPVVKQVLEIFNVEYKNIKVAKRTASTQTEPKENE